MFSRVTPYKNQHYDALKKQCIQSKTLFEDDEFPASSSSLFYRKPPSGNVVWKRPAEICGADKKPQLFVEGISSHDLNQGEVGNCWFVAACSCLALKPNLWKNVIPDWKEQDWDHKHPENYAGIFHFRFWIFGKWLDVVVDDRLPTVNGKLIYCSSKDHNEFWSALLEKAYAKLYGCYESLNGGNTGDAVVDFSGAVTEPVDLAAEAFHEDKNRLEEFFHAMIKVYERDGIISCSIRAEEHEIEAKMPNGLVKGHAYAVTAVKQVRLGHGLLAYFKNETIPMIRMRNPWGQREWNGAWSDGSEEWNKVGESMRKSLELTVEDDGEFWMSFEDWCKNFTNADVCRIVNTSILSINKTWEEVVYFGNWTNHGDPFKNRNGGCSNYNTFLQNPQYMFNVEKVEDEVMIYLQQKNRKMEKKDGENLFIGFGVYKVELNRKYRLHSPLTLTKVQTSVYINARSVFMRCKVPEGRYVIIPSTHKPGEVGEFMLRIFTDDDSDSQELTKDKPGVKCFTPLCGYPRAITHVYVKEASGLENQDGAAGADPYVVISCERETVTSSVYKDTLDPKFETSAIFLRKKPSEPITVAVWNKNPVKDQFMGQVVLSDAPKDSHGDQPLKTLHLRKSGSKMADEMPGVITLKIVSDTELTAL